MAGGRSVVGGRSLERTAGSEGWSDAELGLDARPQRRRPERARLQATAEASNLLGCEEGFNAAHVGLGGLSLLKVRLHCWRLNQVPPGPV
jgi:hypothetical protein